VDTIKLRIYEDKLLRRKHEISNSLRRLDKENAEVTGKKQLDWIDQAADESEIRLLDQLSEGYSHELERIDVALGKILTGGYGTCPACHQSIPKGRLDTFPEAVFCSRCQESREALESV
jgi:RNA polymerase-binding transcription factor DksA